MKTTNFLVKFKSYWNDEFQCQQFRIFKDIIKEEIDSYIQEIIETGGYFGTNEGFEPGSLSISDFEIIEISKSEVNVITRIIGSEFGLGILW